MTTIVYDSLLKTLSVDSRVTNRKNNSFRDNASKLFYVKDLGFTADGKLITWMGGAGRSTDIAWVKTLVSNMSANWKPKDRTFERIVELSMIDENCQATVPLLSECGELIVMRTKWGSSVVTGTKIKGLTLNLYSDIQPDRFIVMGSGRSYATILYTLGIHRNLDGPTMCYLASRLDPSSGGVVKTVSPSSNKINEIANISEPKKYMVIEAFAQKLYQN